LTMQVEKAPTVIKAGVSKAEAEELKKKLEAGVFTLCCNTCMHPNNQTSSACMLLCPLAAGCHLAVCMPCRMQYVWQASVSAQLLSLRRSWRKGHFGVGCQRAPAPDVIASGCSTCFADVLPDVVRGRHSLPLMCGPLGVACMRPWERCCWACVDGAFSIERCISAAVYGCRMSLLIGRRARGLGSPPPNCSTHSSLVWRACCWGAQLLGFVGQLNIMHSREC